MLYVGNEKFPVELSKLKEYIKNGKFVELLNEVIREPEGRRGGRP